MMLFDSLLKPESVQWKNSPIKTELTKLQRVTVPDTHSASHTVSTSSRKQVVQRQSMSIEDHRKFVEEAASMFENSPFKPKLLQPELLESQTTLNKQQPQSQFELLFASPNESFEIAPYEYTEETEQVSQLDDSQRQEEVSSEPEQQDSDPEEEYPEETQPTGDVGDFQALLRVTTAQAVSMSQDSLDFAALRRPPDVAATANDVTTAKPSLSSSSSSNTTSNHTRMTDSHSYSSLTRGTIYKSPQLQATTTATNQPPQTTFVSSSSGSSDEPLEIDIETALSPGTASHQLFEQHVAYLEETHVALGLGPVQEVRVEVLRLLRTEYDALQEMVFRQAELDGFGDIISAASREGSS